MFFTFSKRTKNETNKYNKCMYMLESLLLTAYFDMGNRKIYEVDVE